MFERNIFSLVANSQANNKSDNFRDGKGIAEVVQCIGKPDANDGPTFIARFKIVSSESKGDMDPKTKQPIQPNAPGSRVGWPQKLTKFKSAPGNVKSFFLNLLGKKESDMTAESFTETMKDAISPKQPARGMLVAYETYQQETKSGANKGAINTYVRFVNVPKEKGNTPEEIKKRREELDKTDPVVD